MKIANIDREILHNCWTTLEILMKFSVKVWLVIILKVAKNQGFTLSLEDTFFEKPQRGERRGFKLTPAAVLELIWCLLNESFPPTVYLTCNKWRK